MPTINELFNQAVRYHQSGQLALAEPIYRQILQTDPANSQACHFLGILARQSGNPQAAIDLIRQAIALNPTAVACHFNLGMVHKDLGQLTEAAECFHKELRVNPHHADSLINLGIVLVEQGQTAEAIACYRQALRINPQHADAHNNLGIALALQKQVAEAVACFRNALRINPNNVGSYLNLGNTLLNQGEFLEAAHCFQQALNFSPENTNAHNNLGLALLGQGRRDDAVGCFRQALRINPAYANAHNNLGITLFEQWKPEEAIASFRQALQCAPGHVDARLNLASALVAQKDLAGAAACYQQVLNVDPQHKIALWNRSHLRLLQGDFEGGWQDYEQRWLQRDAVPRGFQQPRWNGSSLEGKTILVYAEQLLGDTIQFARFLPLVKRLGGTVLFECQPALVDLLTGMNGPDQIFPGGAPLPPFDVQIPLLSLPGLFGTTPATFPADIPYLTVDQKLTHQWGEEIKEALSFSGEPKATASLNVGIVWQGSKSHKNDLRSVPLTHFEVLAKVEGVRLWSLQVGPGMAELAQISFPVTDLGSRFDPHSLVDLAAVLLNLDLVVTVDTAVGHLAGALGVPVWVALPYVACWRWFLDRSDSPWYPTMRLFRQSKLGEWSTVFEAIAAAVSVLRTDEKYRKPFR